MPHVLKVAFLEKIWKSTKKIFDAREQISLKSTNQSNSTATQPQNNMQCRLLLNVLVCQCVFRSAVFLLTDVAYQQRPRKIQLRSNVQRCICRATKSHFVKLRHQMLLGQIFSAKNQFHLIRRNARPCLVFFLDFSHGVGRFNFQFGFIACQRDQKDFHLFCLFS